jgi:hypothetical protein
MKRAAGILLLIAGVWAAAAYRTGTGRIEQSFYSVGETPRNMGEVIVGCESTYTFRVTNNTSPDLYSFTVVFSFTSTNPDFIVAPSGPISVPPASSREVTLTFRPSRSGPLTAQIGYTVSNGQTSIPGGFIVGGTGVRIVVQPSNLDFGRVLVGSSSTLGFAITTDYPGPVLQARDYSPVSGFEVGQVGQGLAVRFTPPAPGVRRETIQISGIRRDVGNQLFPGVTYQNCPFTVTITVTGEGYESVTPTISPSAITFDPVQCGTPAAAQSVTVSNPGSTPMQRGGFSISPQSAAAALAISPAGSFTIPARGSQTFSIGYTPQNNNAYQASVQFFGFSPDNVSLTPPALAVRAAACQTLVLSSDSSRLDFGDAAVGTTQRRSVNLSTNSASAVQVAVAITPAGAFTASPASFSLSRDLARAVEFAFAPSSATTFNATATLSAPGLTSTTVALSGRGIAPALNYRYVAGTSTTSVNPGGEIVAPNTNLRETSQVQFQVVNGGAAAGTVTNLSITPAGGPFSLVNPPTLPANVPANGQLSVTITFRPTTVGRSTATLNIGGQTFNLRGDGVLPPLPTFAISGPGASIDVRQQPQPTVTVTINRTYTEEISGTLRLRFQPPAGLPDDPMVAFVVAPAGRTVNFTIPAGQTQARFGNSGNVVFLAGTTAGAILLDIQNLRAAGQAVTATSPVVTAQVSPLAPVFRGDPTCSVAGSTVNVVAVAYSTPRRITGVNLRLSPAPNATVTFNTPSPDPFVPEFNNWFAQNTGFGGLFTLTIPLQVAGDLNAIGTISLALVNNVSSSETRDIPFSRCR